jgi:hypothetical protein
MTIGDRSEPLEPAREALAIAIASGDPLEKAYEALGGEEALGMTLKGVKQSAAITMRVAWLKGQAVAPRRIRPKAAEIDPERFTEMLIEDRELAYATGQASAAVSASKTIGQHKGYMVERQVTVSAKVDISDIEMAQRIAFLLMSNEGPAPKLINGAAKAPLITAESAEEDDESGPM